MITLKRLTVIQTGVFLVQNFPYRGFARQPCCMAGKMKMFCIRKNICSHRKKNLLFLPCNMAAVQNLYLDVSQPLHFPARAALILFLSIFGHKFGVV